MRIYRVLGAGDKFTNRFYRQKTRADKAASKYNSEFPPLEHTNAGAYVQTYELVEVGQ